MADVAEVHAFEDEGTAAAGTEFRIGPVAQLRLEQLRRLDSRVGHPGQVLTQGGHHRVVGVEDRGHTLGSLGQRPAEVGRRRLQLSVPVQLVTEEIRHNDHARPGFGDQQRQAGLVDLEHADARRQRARPRGPVDQGRGDAEDEVGARLVGDRRPPPRIQDVPDQRRGRGLAVGPAHDNAAAVEAGGELGQDSPVDPTGDVTGKGGTPAHVQRPAHQRRQFSRPERGAAAGTELCLPQPQAGTGR